MPVVITRMPSTGAVTNVSYDDSSIEAVRCLWEDNQEVQVLTDEEYRNLPRCPTCGTTWIALRTCNECK